jgi:large subunit ribosomal protein L29
MALLKLAEIREMSPDIRDEKLRELRDELMHERGIGAMGGAPASPGKIKALRKNIARILTIQKETISSEDGKKKASSGTGKTPSLEGGDKEVGE